MLAEIIKMLRETDVPLNIEELSRRLGTERSALEGMLEFLVRQGKLKKVNPGSIECEHCSGRVSCTILRKDKPLGAVYELTEKTG